MVGEVIWQAQWIQSPDPSTPATPLPIFRKRFEINKSIAKATIHICGLGQFELHLNGQCVSEDLFSPAWSCYSKTCYFMTYDVTSMLHDGHNAVGVMLGNGMYNVMGGRYHKFKGTFGPPKLIAQIQIDFTEGTSQTVLTDDSWRCAPGPIRFSCIYGGEDYDAREEQVGWDKAEFDDAKWAPVAVTKGPGGELLPQPSPPVRIMQEFAPKKVTEPQSGVKVFDLRQNFSGFPAITVTGPAGTTIKLITAELLADTGLVSQKNSGSPTYFSYTLKGAGEEIWHPRFSYTGFRYVQVEGTGSFDKFAIKGLFIHNSNPRAGEFSCSNPLLNQIHELIDMAIRSNMQTLLTDCPHREKLGWLEQVHLMGPAILFDFNAISLYRKICRDMRDAQHDDGYEPTIAPEYVVFKDKGSNKPNDFSNSPEWGSSVVIAPWLVYQRSGDREVLAENYDAMKRYVANLKTRENPPGIIDFGLGDWYDIGLGAPGYSKLTSKGITGTAIYFCDITILARAAAILGKPDEAAEFTKEAARVRDAFNAKYFKPDFNEYDKGSQCANAMPLALNIVEPANRAAVLEHLIGDIRQHENHITAGDIGFRYVVEALGEAGRSDVMYDLLTRTDPPSYGAQLANGATTLTEAWDADPHSSQNHLMLGHAMIWFYQYLAGIRFDLSRDPPEQIIIQPAVVGDLTWVKGSYASAVGKIEVDWERKDGKLRLSVTLPEKVRGMVCVPTTDAASVRVATVGKSKPAVRKDREDGAWFEVEGGKYDFDATFTGA